MSFTLFSRCSFVVLLIGALVFTAPSGCLGAEINPFTTDGCSVFPDGTFDQQSLWSKCCIQHDISYWMGGTHEEKVEADRELEACVAAVGEPEIAKLMLAGVTAGGSAYFPTNYRWGYGWPYLRGYKKLTSDEKSAVKKRLVELGTLIDKVSRKIQ